MERMEWEAQNAPRLYDLLVPSVILSHALQAATTTTVHIGSKHFSDTDLWVPLISLKKLRCALEMIRRLSSS